jgi:hypothetical protein
LNCEESVNGAGSNVHVGDIEGAAAPDGNRLRLLKSGPGGCTVDMKLLGLDIVADDNMGCGGMNVRFEGIWKRVKP